MRKCNTSPSPTQDAERALIASLQRRVVGLARKVALSHDVNFWIVHQVLNEAVGVAQIDDCNVEDLRQQLVLAETWLNSGIEPRPEDWRRYV